MSKNLTDMLDNALAALSGFVPTLIGALAVLIVGWIAAAWLGRAVRAGIRRTQVSARLAELFGTSAPEGVMTLERWIGRLIFIVLMLFVLVGFFQVLGLTHITQPINEFLKSIFGYLPRLIGPVILVIVAWIVATLLRFVIRRGLTAINFDDKFKGVAENDEDRLPVTKTISETIYWLTYLLFLPAVLSALNLGGLLKPIQVMVDKVLAYLPNMLAAALILIIGWIVARLVRRIVVNLLDSMGTQQLSQESGLQTAMGDQRLSNVLGLIVFILILIPVLVASLNALELSAITNPASNMLNEVLSIIPNLFAAALVLVIAYVIAKIVSGLVSNLLAGIGFDRVLENIGLSTAKSEDHNRQPSQVVGYLLMVGVMMFAVIESLRLIEFTTLANLVTEFLVFAANILLGLAIIGLGLFLANLAATAIAKANFKHNKLLANAARVTVIILAVAMGLDLMDVAGDIINIAFAIALGAVAIALAVAFGIGGRETAAKIIQNWASSLLNPPPKQ